MDVEIYNQTFYDEYFAQKLDELKEFNFTYDGSGILTSNDNITVAMEAAFPYMTATTRNWKTHVGSLTNDALRYNINKALEYICPKKKKWTKNKGKHIKGIEFSDNSE